MQTIEVLDIKPFMMLLFQKTDLDSYEFISGEIRTDMTYSLDGHINKSFFSEEESEILELNQNTYLPWRIAKEKIFSIIKGKKTPSVLKIVLKLSEQKSSAFLETSGSSLGSNDIDAMFLNVLFQDNSLHITCGVSYKIFTMDKSLESELTNSILTLLKSNSITSEISS